MSSDLKAEATIELETSSLEKSSDKAKKEFEEIGKSATKGGTKADKALDKTGQKAKKTAGSLKETGAAGKKAGDDVALGANKGARALDQMGTSADGADNSMETLSTSMIGLAQTATGVSDAIFGLQASLVGLEKTRFGIVGMEIAIERMEQGLTVAINEATLSTLELTQAAEDLAFAEINLGLEMKQSAADTLALDGQMVTLGINMSAAIVQSAIMIKTLLVMRGVRAAVTATTAVDSGVTATNTAVTGTNTLGTILKTKATIIGTLATRAATFATRAFTTSMLLSPLSGFAIAAIAAGAAFIALNDNIGGVRDSIEDLTGSERGSIPTLGFSITGLGNDIDDLGGDIDDTRTDMEKFQDQTQDVIDRFTGGEGFIPVIDSATESVNTFSTALSPNATNGLNAFSDTFIGPQEKLINFAGALFRSSGELIDMTGNINLNSRAMNDWGRVFTDTTGRLVFETNALRQNTDAIKENSEAIEENSKKNQDSARDAKEIRKELKKARDERIALEAGPKDEIRSFLAKSQNNFADPNFRGGGFSSDAILLRSIFLPLIGITPLGPARISRKSQQLEAIRQRIKTQEQEVNELNAFFGSNIFRVQRFTASRGRTSVTPTPEGRQILRALGLDVNTAQLLKDAQVNLDNFFGTDVPYPILGTTRRNVTIHNGRVVTRVSSNVIVGSRTVTSGGTGESRLAALSLAAEFAREKIAEKEESERIISEFRGGGGFGDIAQVRQAVSFLSESFGFDRISQRRIEDRIRFLERTEKELLLATTV